MKNSSAPKDRILETAYKLFYIQGYNVTGINQILDESKVAKASLYQHFGSKEDLGIEYIKKVREDWFQSFENHLSKKEDPKQKILAAFDFLEMNLRLNDYKGCRFLNLLSDIDNTSKGMQQQILEHKTKLRKLFKTMIKLYTNDRIKLAIPNAHDSIYLLFEAAIMESKVYRDVWPIVAAKQTTNNILTLTT
ncbi:MAG: TetR/AcrR family transcriptional regulator [Bacteroidetes bacterium]|nr:TetR/AcrR family transcriptional regulator [Bacteroidota bacterium]